MKRVLTAILAVGFFLPLIAAPASCTAQDMGLTFLRLFANPACLQQYGFTIPSN